MVIGIIALLISILLPSLNRARAAAQTIKCASNMRQIGQALQLYHNDSRGKLIPFLIPSGTAPAAWPGGYFWANQLVRMKYIKAPIGVDPTGAKDQLSAVFTCPVGVQSLMSSLTGPPNLVEGVDDTFNPTSGINNYLRAHDYSADATGAASTDRVGTHYMLNARKANSTNALNATDPDVVIAPFLAYTNSRSYLTNGQYSRTLSLIRNQSTTVLMLEGNSYELNRASRLAARHNVTSRSPNGSTNLLFFDGHVATFSTKPYYDSWVALGRNTDKCFVVKYHGVQETHFRIND